MKFVVITPTTGHPLLKTLLASINNLKLNLHIQIDHLIVIDGQEFKDKVSKTLNTVEVKNKKQLQRFIFQLPYNTGGGGFLGHRIYAAISQLVVGDWVLFLDEDNSFEPEHILNFYLEIEKNPKLEWMYSLRSITDGTRKICNDDCESLGYLSRVFYGNNPDNYLIDTNCYCIKYDVIKNHSHIWNSIGTNDETNPDRRLAIKLMREHPNFVCTKKHTLNYFVNNRSQGSVKDALFIKGNEFIVKKYGNIPWNREVVFLAHFNREQTERVIDRVYNHTNGKDWESVAYKQWLPNNWDALSKAVLLKNAYTSFIPAGSTVVFTMCHFEEMPQDILIVRKDIKKVLYTIEGPNIRHQKQWDLEFLLSIFDKVVTYWEPLIQFSSQINNRIEYFPFVHRFDMDNRNDLACISKNNNVGRKDVCIVLQNRNIRGNYSINGISLNALDYLRWEYARKLGKRIHCYGDTWEPVKDVVNYSTTQNRFLDNERVIDLMAKHTFALIIENCDADGYVSEKIYDALCVGCIPLYYGNNNKRVGIPDDCYIDLKTVSPDELPLLIDSMDDDFINLMRQNIYNKRMEILSKVSVNALSAKMLEIIKK